MPAGTLFALSAASYIEEAVGHFDLRWICSALRYLAEARDRKFKPVFLGDQFTDRPEEWFKKPMPYVQTEADLMSQQVMISRLIDKKSKIREVSYFDSCYSRRDRSRTV